VLIFFLCTKLSKSMPINKLVYFIQWNIMNHNDLIYKFFDYIFLDRIFLFSIITVTDNYNKWVDSHETTRSIIYYNFFFFSRLKNHGFQLLHLLRVNFDSKYISCNISKCNFKIFTSRMHTHYYIQLLFESLIDIYFTAVS